MALTDIDSKADTDMQGYSSRQPNYYSQPQQRRPIPKFDMNLKDLFSEDETDKRSFSRVSNQVNAMRPPPTPIKPEAQMQPFTADLKISPQLRMHAQQPFFNPPPTVTNTNPQTFSPPALSPPVTQSPPNPMPSPYQVSNQLSYNAFSQPVSSTYPDLGGFSDLDFLDSFPVHGNMGPGDGSGGGAGGGMGGVGVQDVGIGFGMGFGDGTHDWSDGNGVDLFDGFFFGPGGTGMQ